MSRSRGPPSSAPPTRRSRGIAHAAIEFLDRWWRAWRDTIDALGDDGLWRPIGPAEGNFSVMQLGEDDPFIGLVLHINRELMHHGAEICVLRDLFRAQQPRDDFIRAVLHADRAAIAELQRADPGIVERYRALRPDLVLRAVETQNPDAVRLVVELGFDVNHLAPPTALHYAAMGGHLDLIDPPARARRRHDGARPAVRRDARGVGRLLLADRRR